jgi:putative flavoprotein involved in K+ transport
MAAARTRRGRLGPGIYFAGLPFQYAFSSMLVGGAGRYASYFPKHIAAHRPDKRRSSPR